MHPLSHFGTKAKAKSSRHAWIGVRGKGRLACLCKYKQQKLCLKQSNVITGVCKEARVLMANQANEGSAGTECVSDRKRNYVLIINPKRIGAMLAHAG